jgi:hypothetical protein
MGRVVGYGVSQVPTNGMLGGMAYQDPINVTVNNISVGSGTLTGTASQPLQVTGGAYVSGNIGIGTTNPLVALDVAGDARITGIITASGGIQVGATTSIVVGSSFIKNNSVGLGETTTTGRDAGISTAAGTLIFNSSSKRIEFYNGNSWTSIKSFDATGGTITFSGGKTIHTFTGSGTFTVTIGSSDVDYLVVAGGGGGGTHSGGGGGAGGLLSNHPDMPSPRRGSAVQVSPGSYSVIVGSGGAGGDGTYPSPGESVGSDGLPSSIAFPTPVSTSGGGGGGNHITSGRAGGSGGGGGRTSAGGTVSPPSNQGFAGGSPGVGAGPNNSYPGGGGGGAGGLGLGSITNGGAGGPGLPISISGTSVTYAGGGGGNSQYPPGVGGAGGPGGGGAGATISGLGVDGTTNLGGGGGGGQYDGGTGSGNNNGNGGSGIVIIAYPS